MGWTASQMPDQSGKTIIVTGGNGGLGLETARELARKGAHVIIAARNLDKAATAEADIKAELPNASVEVRQLDLASKASIKEFADSIIGDFDKVDTLFNNAGIMAVPERQTEDGFEMQFGTNHLGHFYLTYAAHAAAAQGRRRQGRQHHFDRSILCRRIRPRERALSRQLQGVGRLRDLQTSQPALRHGTEQPPRSRRLGRHGVFS